MHAVIITITFYYCYTALLLRLLPLLRKILVFTAYSTYDIVRAKNSLFEIMGYRIRPHPIRPPFI